VSRWCWRLSGGQPSRKTSRCLFICTSMSFKFPEPVGGAGFERICQRRVPAGPHDG
jgi:hypothetical protein